MSFDFDLFVIGAGSGGVRAARFAAGFGARVAVAESRYLGGTCVNVGCVPKKLLVYGAHFSEDFEQARAYGWSAGEAQFDWATLIGNKNREIQRLNGIYRNLLVNSGVTLLEGHARLLDAHNVEVDGQRFSAKHILIATGGWPQVPDIPGKEHAITSNEAFFLERLPRRVLVVGGGYIAVEFASIFNGLGAETTLLYRRDLFLRGFDRSVREHLRDELGKKGLDLQFNSDIARIDKQADGSLAEIDSGGVREAPFELTFKCQSGMTNGTGAGATALGIRVSSGALAASPALGLVNASGGLSYLLSDRYGQPGIAQGVGIRIYRNGAPMTLLANEDSAGGSNAEARGWYPAVGGATQSLGGSGGIDQYGETFRARLEKLSLGTRPGVTAGRVEATAQVVIRVQ